MDCNLSFEKAANQNYRKASSGNCKGSVSSKVFIGRFQRRVSKKCFFYLSYAYGFVPIFEEKSDKGFFLKLLIIKHPYYKAPIHRVINPPIMLKNVGIVLKPL